ncbi:MAG: alpha/beta fold hydrolase [Boseongicola sp.]
MSLLLFGITASVAAAPFACEAMRQPMSSVIQEGAPGELVDLPMGHTHFRWSGNEDGPVAVCIHGLSTPSYIFAGTELTLAALGYRVLTYDLYGRGYSDRVSGKQSLDFFLRQLRDLLESQNIGRPITVVGYSMGGAIATAFAAEEGKNVKSLILMAPSGLIPTSDMPLSRLWTMPVAGDWLTLVAGGWALRRELAGQIEDPTIVPDLLDRQAAETGMRGYLPALLSSRRHTLNRTLEDDHIAIRDYKTPVLSVWGADDPIIPIRSMALLSELNSHAHHFEIKGAGHAFPQTHPAKVTEAFRGFLES